jgi:PhnB protein
MVMKKLKNKKKKKLSAIKNKSKKIKTKARTRAVKRKKKVSALPKGYHNITPYLIVDNAAKAIQFYKTVFDAKEVMRMDHPGGKIGHAELKMGDAKIMLADEYPEMDVHSPKKYGGTPVIIHLYVKNVDATFDKAISAGATLIRPVENMFYGDRSGTVLDPYGHMWNLSTHVEDVTPAKMKKRAAEVFSKKQ